MNKAGEWILAKEPIHFYFSNHMGMDCGYSFGNSLLDCVPDSVSIAIIPCAVGGSGIDHWLTDSLYRNKHLWSNMKSSIKATAKEGTLKGMIWHQGETDAKTERLLVHKSKLNTFFTKVREEVGDPNMPIVVGELGKFDSNRPKWRALNDILKGMSAESETVSLILTSDLDDTGDEVHFNSEAIRMMGKRYAIKMAELHGLAESVAAIKSQK